MWPLVTSPTKSPIRCSVCVCVCVWFVRIHMFVCLLGHHLLRLEPRECELTSTRGISCLYRAEKVFFFFFLFFCQATWSISIPRQTLFTPPQATANPFPKRPSAIKLQGYIWVPTGIVCPGLLKRHLWAVLSPLSMARGAIRRKRQTAPVSFWEAGVAADVATENQWPVSHEHLISWTLVHC